MKMPEPVAWLHQQGNYSDPSGRQLFDDEKDRGWTEVPLFTEAQLREALASHEAVMRMALECLKATEEYLRIEVNEAYARDANINTINDWKQALKQHREAIKALEEQLK